jgi:hypothetical protein
METMVGISRKYGEKKVEMTVFQRAENEKAVVLSISLDDFFDALIKEVDSVTWVFTQAEFQKRMLAAKDVVLEEIKITTIPNAHKIAMDS